jgi:hypothetical protein
MNRLCDSRVTNLKEAPFCNDLFSEVLFAEMFGELSGPSRKFKNSAIHIQDQNKGCDPAATLLGPMRQHSRWTTGIDLLPNQLARSL